MLFMRIIKKIKKILRNVYDNILFTKNKLRFGEIGVGTKVESLSYLTNSRNIYLGKDVRIFKNSRIELITAYSGECFMPKLFVGDNAQIHQNCHITCANSIIIEKNVIIVSNVTITDIIHPYEDPYTPINYNKIKTLPVLIGEQTYLYNNVVVLPGSRIGKHCVIGANSVVSGEIPDYSVAVGSPAKVIKKYNFESKKWERVFNG